jgi:hypothetical protein
VCREPNRAKPELARKTPCYAAITAVADFAIQCRRRWLSPRSDEVLRSAVDERVANSRHDWLSLATARRRNKPRRARDPTAIFEASNLHGQMRLTYLQGRGFGSVADTPRMMTQAGSAWTAVLTAEAFRCGLDTDDAATSDGIAQEG